MCKILNCKVVVTIDNYISLKNTTLKKSFGASLIKYNIFRSDQKCYTLGLTWKHVQTTQILPVNNAQEIDLTCLPDFINKGGNKATCQNGIVVPKNKPPDCFKIGKLLK